MHRGFDVCFPFKYILGPTRFPSVESHCLRLKYCKVSTRLYTARYLSGVEDTPVWPSCSRERLHSREIRLLCRASRDTALFSANSYVNNGHEKKKRTWGRFMEVRHPSVRRAEKQSKEEN